MTHHSYRDQQTFIIQWTQQSIINEMYKNYLSFIHHQNIDKTSNIPPTPPPIIISTPKMRKKTKKNIFSCRNLGWNEVRKIKPPPVFRIFTPKNRLWSGGVLEKAAKNGLHRAFFTHFCKYPHFYKKTHLNFLTWIEIPHKMHIYKTPYPPIATASRVVRLNSDAHVS